MKAGFTLVEMLIALSVLIVIFGIFGISMITAFKVAHIEKVISTAQSELRLLDMKMYSLIGSKGCEIRNENVDCPDDKRTIRIDSYVVKVGDPIEITDCRVIEGSSRTIEIRTEYELMGEKNTKTLHYPLPIGTLCK